MKLICPKRMTAEQRRALTLCLADAGAPTDPAEALEAVAGQLAAIEASVAVIDRGFPVPQLGRIDLLAADAGRRPIIIGLDEVLDMPAVCSGVLRAAWVAGHLEVLAHALRGGGFCPEVRVWHIAREVTPEARVLVRRMGAAAPTIFVRQELLLGAERWLVVQPLAGEVPQPVPSVREAAPAMPEAAPLPVETLAAGRMRVRPLPLASVLSEDEIEGIMRGRHASDDDVTSRMRNF